MEKRRLFEISSPMRKPDSTAGGISINLFGEQFTDLLDHLTWNGIPQTICLDHFLSIDINAELSEAAFDRFGLDITIFIQLGRHTGGHPLFDRSDGAVVDRYFLHRSASIFNQSISRRRVLFALIRLSLMVYLERIRSRI